MTTINIFNRKKLKTNKIKIDRTGIDSMENNLARIKSEKKNLMFDSNDVIIAHELIDAWVLLNLYFPYSMYIQSHPKRF